MKHAIVAAVAALAAIATAEDVLVRTDSLVSSRLGKRGIDANGHFNMSFFHVNDVHAHLDEFSSSGTDCTNPSRGCFGGYARIKRTVDRLRPQYNDSLWLNAGDEFQGTMFYSFYKGWRISETLNQLGFDAMTLGNHEFDGGDDLLGDFIQNLTFPIVSANVKSTHPKLNATILPYIIFEKQGIAIVGCTTTDTPGISSPGDGTTFLDVVTTVQQTVNFIRSTTNITRVAALTHIGYDKDQELAESTTGIHLIIGGHSHTPLGNITGVTSEGAYPTIRRNKDGDEVFIVTAWRWGQVLGYIDVTFDDAGKVLAYHGGPILMDNRTEVDAGLQAQIDEWRGPFEAFSAQKVGESRIDLDQTTCQRGECLLGDFMTDAMYEYRLNSSEGTPPAFALMNAGGIRATIPAGDVTRGHVLTSFPFGNAVVELEYGGEELWKILEGAVSRFNQFNNRPLTSWFQVSKNIKIQYNPANANGTKLVSVDIGGKPLDTSASYKVVTVDFLAGGGDNIFLKTTDFVTLDTLDEVLIRYIGLKSPINISLDGRQAAVNGTGGSPTPSGSGGPAPTQTGGPSGAGMVGAPLWSTVLAVAAVAAVLSLGF